MVIKFNFTKAIKTSGNVVLFVDEKFKSSNIKKFITSFEYSYINDLLKTSDLKKNILIFELNSKRKIILISIKKNIKNFDIENLGAEFYGRINHEKKKLLFNQYRYTNRQARELC